MEGFYVSLDKGVTWQLRSNKPNILGSSPDGSDDGGQAWYDLAVAVSPYNSNIVYIGGVNLWRSADQGRTWQIVGHWTGSGAPYIHADIHDLEFRPGTDELFVGCDGGLYRKKENETQWQPLNNGLAIMQF